MTYGQRMFTANDCLPCLVRQAAEAAARATEDPAAREEILRRVCRYLSEMPFSQSPPEAARELYALVREVSGCGDLFAEAKRSYNTLLLDAWPTLQEKVRRSNRRFEAAARLAIGGNTIDVGTGHTLDARHVFDTLEQVMEQPLALNALQELRTAVQHAKQVLYLADNAGEIVLDKLFIEQFPARTRVTVAVKSGPILNDATLDDAHAVGLSPRAAVIANGFDAPGTVLSKCSAEFRACFEAADVVISKGQGNYETLLGCRRAQLFYMLKVKCPVVSRQLNVPMGSLAVLQESPATPIRPRISVIGSDRRPMIRRASAADSSHVSPIG